MALFSLRRKRPPLAVVPDPPEAGAAGGSVAEAALAELDGLYSLALHLTGSRADAEDLVQTAYARALAGAARFEAGTNVRAWMFRILRNCFIDLARRRKIVLEIPDDTLDVQLADSRGVDQLRYVTASEVSAAIAVLPVELRLVVVLEVEGFSEAEIADIARCAPGTVKSRLSRAKAKLRAALAEHGAEGAR